jgi:serine/threonine protein kinase
LPDNGLPWRKLRANDFSDVNLSLMSSDLALLIQSMLEKNPDRRPAIYDVLRHPVTKVVCEARARGLEQSEGSSQGSMDVTLTSANDGPLHSLVAQGAICPEDDGFLDDILGAAAFAEAPTSPSPSPLLDGNAMELDVI